MLSYSSISERGDRPVNEDSVYMAQAGKSWCFALADGLGGHGGGDIASALVSKKAAERFQDQPEVSGVCVGDAMQYAQDCLMRAQEETGRQREMKSTLTLLLLDGEKAVWGYIGDSRIYRFSGGHYVKRTLDHSVPQMLVAAGEITEDEIRRHADRNRLLRVMGIEWNGPRYMVSEEMRLDPGDAFLLCSDGFWEWIRETEMEQCLAQADNAQEWLRAMTELVRAHGAGQNMDNYSAICILVAGDMDAVSTRSGEGK